MGEKIKTIQEHVAKDMILEYLVERMPSQDIYCDAIHQAVFPDQDKEVTYLLLNRIVDYNPDIIVWTIKDHSLNYFSGWFHATSITEQFLKSGGFSAIHQNNLRLIEKENAERQLQLQVNHDTIRNNKSTRIIAIVNTAISIAALVISLFALLKGD